LHAAYVIGDNGFSKVAVLVKLLDVDSRMDVRTSICWQLREAMSTENSVAQLTYLRLSKDETILPTNVGDTPGRA